MFKKNLVKLVILGVDIERLICDESKIFRIKCEYSSWPQHHSNCDSATKPFNQSIIEVENQYDGIFPEFEEHMKEKG